MQFVWLQSDFAFSRNPMMLRDDMPALKGSEVDGSLVLSLGGRKIYEGRVSMPMYVDIAGIVDPCLSFFTEPRFRYEDGEGSYLKLVEDWQFIEDHRRIDAILSYGSGDDYEAYCYALKGGISKQNFNRIISLGEDIFSTKLLNPACNFFMTTRTQTWCISIPETEMSPLYFMLGENESLLISGLVGKEELMMDNPIPGIYALSVENLRKWYYDNFGQLVNAYDVYKVVQGNRAFACRIVITQADAVKEHYGLKFRNSFGIMERIDISGSMVNEYSYPDKDDEMYVSCDVDDFKNMRRRMHRSHHMVISTEICGTERSAYFMDMVSSEEVYLERDNGLLIRVIPAVEDIKIAAHQETPIPVELGLDMVEMECMIMPEVENGEEFMRGRIHSKQFNNPFN